MDEIELDKIEKGLAVQRGRLQACAPGSPIYYEIKREIRALLNRLNQTPGPA